MRFGCAAASRAQHAWLWLAVRGDPSSAPPAAGGKALPAPIKRWPAPLAPRTCSQAADAAFEVLASNKEKSKKKKRTPQPLILSPFEAWLKSK